MKKIFLFGWFGSENTGDDALLDQTFSIINGINDKSEITVLCNKGFSGNCKRQNIKYKPKSVKNLWSEIFNNDVFIFGPGGLFPNKNLKKLIFIYYYILFLKLLKKKVIFLGLGIENCNFDSKLSRFFIKHTVNLIDDCTLRYDYRIYENQKNILNKCLVSADVMFTKDYDIKHAESEDRYVTFALADIFDENRLKEDFLNSVSKFAKRIIDEGYRIHFLTFTKEKDYELNEQVIKLLGAAKNRCTNFNYQEQFDFYLNDISNSDLLVGMRFHSLVFGINLGKKIVPISYSSKNEEVLYDFDLLKYSLRVCVSNDKYFCETICLDDIKLNEIYDEILHSDICEKKINENLEKEKEKAKLHEKMLKKYLNP